MCGVTSLVDHHAGPRGHRRQPLGHTRGLRGSGHPRPPLLRDHATATAWKERARGVRENLRFAREIDVRPRRRRLASPLVDGAIGAHAGFTVGDETLAALGDACGLRAEAPHPRGRGQIRRRRLALPLRRGPRRPPRRGAAASAPSPSSATASGSARPRSSSSTPRGSFLAHNARSNMNNAVGYNALLTRFANVVLGTDGMSADMLEEFRFAAFRHRESGGPWWPGDFLRCLDRGNRLMERYMGAAFGRVMPGRGRRTSCSGTTIRPRPSSGATSRGTSPSAFRRARCAR